MARNGTVSPKADKHKSFWKGFASSLALYPSRPKANQSLKIERSSGMVIIETAHFKLIVPETEIGAMNSDWKSIGSGITEAVDTQLVLAGVKRH